MAKAQIIITSCSRRSLEIEQVKNYLRGNGYAITGDEWNVDPDADLILLSTCGFTKPAEDFGFETLRRVQEVKKPAAKVVFGGCIPQINPDRVMQEFNRRQWMNSMKPFSSANRLVSIGSGVTVSLPDLKHLLQCCLSKYPPRRSTDVLVW